MEKEMTIKILLDDSYKIDQSFLTSLIAGINSSTFVPISEIKIDDTVVFNSTNGFSNL